MTQFAFNNTLFSKTISYAMPLALLLGMSMSTHAAKVYKWVDENGRTHYSQTPPPAKAKTSKAMNVSTARSQPTAAQLAATGSTAGAAEAIKGDGEMAQDGKPNPDAERAKQLEGELAARKKAEKDQRCQALRKSKDNLAIGGRIYEMKDGQRKYLSGAEIDAKRKKVNAAYSRGCR